MNWKQVQTIFIIVFLGLNVFLGYQLWDKHTNTLEMVDIYESSLDELMHVMHVEVETELSVDEPEMAQWSVRITPPPRDEREEIVSVHNQQMIPYGNRLLAQFQEPIPFDDVSAYRANADGAWLAEYIPRGEQYAWDPYAWNPSLEERGTFLQHIDERPIFGGMLLFQHEEDAIVGYQQIYYELLNQGTLQSVISSYTAVRSLLDNLQQPLHATIEDVQLGYFGQVYDTDIQVITPAWRITIGGEEEPFYINAFTGAIEYHPLRDEHRLDLEEEPDSEESTNDAESEMGNGGRE